MRDKYITKHLHITKRTDGWSICLGITRDTVLNEFYLHINLFKWSISIGKINDSSSFDLDSYFME